MAAKFAAAIPIYTALVGPIFFKPADDDDDDDDNYVKNADDVESTKANHTCTIVFGNIATTTTIITTILH